jgi:hypothetical protein
MGGTVTYVHIMDHLVGGQPSIIQNHTRASEDVDGSPVRGSWATSLRPFWARVRKIAKSDYLASSCLSTWNSSAPTGRISMKFDI